MTIKERNKLIKEEYENGEAIKHIAEKYSLSRRYTYDIIKDQGTIIRGRKSYTKREENEIISLYLKGYSTIAIAEEKYGISSGGVTSILKRNNISLRSLKETNRRYSIDHNSFSFNSVYEITEEQAYWVGFLMGDGNVTIRKRGCPRITIQLHKKDKDHLIKFKNFLKAENPVKDAKNKNREHYRIQVTSCEIAYDLSKFGVVPNKTLIANIKLLKNNKHFWRGLIDADGSIKYNLKKNKYLVSLTGSKNIIYDFCKYVNNNFGTKINPSARKNTNGVFQTGTAGTRIRNLIEYLYRDSIVSLDRKNPYV